MIREENKILQKSNTKGKASWCINCNKAYYQNRARYDSEKHKFICPNCGK
ncbi:MAG: hypothetical protein R2685_11030 [Candidatus Nitrosocosmicus sp.]|nr:endonuclease Q family protein [Candidatus Nitrosocosmicus sp.]